MDKKTSFVVIQDWMLDLDLDLTETVIFAVIWGFSQDGESRFRGSWRYLQNTAKCSRAKVSRSLKMLVENGYVKKVDKVTGGVKLCEYYIETGGITERRVVSLGDGEVVSRGDGGGISARPNNKEYNADTIVSANNENNAHGAHARTRKDKDKFDFVAALVALGVDAQTARDWADIRKSKGARNTQSEYDYVVREILNACERYELTAQECVAFAAGNSWRGFRASWDEVRKIKKNDNEDDRKGVCGQPYYTGDTI